MSRLRLQGVAAGLGGPDILRGVDLDVESGSLTALLGPSGCGKTTLLRVVAGFVAPRVGQVRIDDEVVAGPDRCLAPEARGIALVPQEGALFPHLDVAGNVAFGLPRSVSRAARTARVAEVLELLDLAGYERARPHELSGGQQQRVALARALAPSPRAVLLDEPFAALDAALRAVLRRQVREALIRSGTTALLVTHDQDEALSIADSVAVMRDGRIVAHDVPTSLYSAPADLAVARFVGQLVELPATVSADRAETVLGPLVLADPPAPAGERMVVGIRPEQLRLATPDGPGPGSLATVRYREYYGHDALVHVELPDGQLVAVRTAGQLPEHDRVRVWVEGPVRAYCGAVLDVASGR